jgi:hypothetical protein
MCYYQTFLDLNHVMFQFWRFFFPLILTGWISGQIRINEFMASNTRAFPDIIDFEDYPDWIELHNPNLEDASLDGFFPQRRSRLSLQMAYS